MRLTAHRASSLRAPRLVQVAFLLPAAAVLVVFVGWPLAMVAGLSLFQWDLVGPAPLFVGLENYAAALGGGDYGRLLLQSAAYVAIALAGTFALPAGLALLTTAVPRRAAAVYQSLLFLPAVVAVSVGTLAWQWIYQPEGGPLNALLGALHVPPVNWLNDPGTALLAVGVVASWKFGGFNYLVLLAGLAGVPRDCLEAARVDGAGGVRMLGLVVLPLLRPTLLFAGLTTVLQALTNAFVPLDLLTGGGPAGASGNVLYATYQEGLRTFHAGPASADAVLLMLLLGGVAVWWFRVFDRRAADVG